jgi:hypothetical protein
LGMLTPYAQSGIAPVEGLQVILRDVIRGLGYSADQIIPDNTRNKSLANFVGVGQGRANQGVPAPEVSLDQRSAAALDANLSMAPLPAQ